MNDDVIIAALDERIHNLSKAAALLRGRGPMRSTGFLAWANGTAHRTLSNAGRERIREAQRARWARVKKGIAA